MTVLIATSFTKSLAKLTGQEQSAVKVAAFDIQQSPESPGLSLHRIDRCPDPDFWSARVNRDLRIVHHRRGGDTLLAYVGHHDDAYDWARRRRMDTHPRTGAAQIVEIRETVEEVVTRRYVEEAVNKPPIFAGEDDDTLLRWGVPADWLETVRQATEDTLLDIAGHLPDEAQEALLAAAVGEAPTVRLATDLGDRLRPPRRPAAVPGGRRRVGTTRRTRCALGRVGGVPASGATGVRGPRLQRARARHRLGRNRQDGRGAASRGEAGERGRGQPRAAHDILARPRRGPVGEARQTDTRQAGGRWAVGGAAIASDEEVAQLLSEGASAEGTNIAPGFLADEWRLIVDAWDVRDGDVYRDLPRLGRKVRMAASRRDELWRVFARVRSALEAHSKETEAGLMHRLAREMDDPPFTNVVVDEAQDISVPELTLLAAMAGDRPNGLFFAGDIGQRIFRSPFPWKAAGVDNQGRSRSLKVNYRTSHQIRAKSDLLLPPRLLEADGVEDNRLGVSSVFHGPPPDLHVFDTPEEETAAVGAWLDACLRDGIAAGTIAVLVRSENELPRAEAAIAVSSGNDIRPGLMHDAKGREFRAVAVMACDGDILPSESRLIGASDERALKEIYDTERHLLYVAATRARERLWLSASGAPSEFLDDLLT